jgi:hypothetical protein
MSAPPVDAYSGDLEEHAGRVYAAASTSVPISHRIAILSPRSVVRTARAAPNGRAVGNVTLVAGIVRKRVDILLRNRYSVCEMIHELLPFRKGDSQ